MFYYLKGTAAHLGPNLAVIDCGGVGYACRTTSYTLSALKKGEKGKLLTYLSVRQDGVDLFGFATQGELNCFKLLTAISGVGPKVGMAILSELTPEDVALAAAAGDAKRFTKASGVGQKLAQRIVLELKDKVGTLSGSVSMEGIPQPGGPSASGNASQAVEALVTLGYSASEAAAAVGKLDSALPPEELIRLALKSFGSGK